MSDPSSNIRSRVRSKPWNTLWLPVIALLGAACEPLDDFPGPGSADFGAELIGDYELWRSSSLHVTITPKGIVSQSSPMVPPKVLECGFDDRFILAKRQGVKRRNPDDPQDTFEIPDESVVDYWIIDTKKPPKAYGPLSEAEFASRRLKLGVSSSISLKSIDAYRPD